MWGLYELFVPVVAGLAILAIALGVSLGVIKRRLGWSWFLAAFSAALLTSALGLVVTIAEMRRSLADGYWVTHLYLLVAGVFAILLVTLFVVGACLELRDRAQVLNDAEPPAV